MFGHLNLGLGSVSARLGGITNLLVVPAYDSIGQLLKTYASSFNAEALGYFESSGVSDMANAGSHVAQGTAQAVSPGSENYWVTSGGERSGQYASTLAGIGSENRAAVNIALICGGTNDANPASGVTKGQYKSDLLAFIGFLLEDFPNLKKVYLTPLHRSLDSGASDANYQAVKEAQFEIIAEHPRVYAGSEIYDRDITGEGNNVHPDETEFQGEIARRNAALVAAGERHRGKAGTLGPQVTAAEWRTDHALLTIAHDGAADISVTAGCEDMFAFEVTGDLFKASSVERVDATTLKVDFDNKGFFTPGTDDSFKIGYGAMKALSSTSPEVVRDNAANPMPLRQRIITPVVADPLLGMSFTYDMSAKAGVKTLSGSDVTAITERGGDSFQSSAGYYGTYESANNGALVMPDAASAYRIGSGFTGSAAHLFFLVFYAPDPIPNDGILIGFGNDTSVQVTPRTSLILRTNGNLGWFQNEGDGETTIGSVTPGTWNVVAMDFQSVDSCDAYVNSAVPLTFDPRDNMPTQTYTWFGGGAFSETTTLDGVAGAKYARLWGRAGAPHGMEGDAPIANIMAYLAAQYGG